MVNKLDIRNLEELISKLKEKEEFMTTLGLYNNLRSYNGPLPNYYIEVRNSKMGSQRVKPVYLGREHQGFCFGREISLPRFTLKKDEQGYMLGIATDLENPCSDGQYEEGMAVPIKIDSINFCKEEGIRRALIPLDSPLNQFIVIINEMNKDYC